MVAKRHHVRFYFAPGHTVTKPRELGVDTSSPEDVYAYQSEVDALEALREELREIAITATGAIHDLPGEFAPGVEIVERSWKTVEAGQQYVAWNLFAVAKDGSGEVALSKRLENLAGGVIWAEPIRYADPSVKRVEIPAENLEKGYKCEDCRRFSYEQGQKFLNQETHRFEKSSAAMYRDIVELIAEHCDVEAPNSLEIFGACLEDSKLVPRNHPGCTKYSPRGVYGTPKHSGRVGDDAVGGDNRRGGQEGPGAEDDCAGFSSEFAEIGGKSAPRDVRTL